MLWRYGGPPTARDAILRTLLRIFRQLLLAIDGDVEESLRQLDGIGRRYGLLGRGTTIEDFRRWLERRGEIAAASGARMALTPKGERALRRQALSDVFHRMRREGSGEHRLPMEGGAGDFVEETRAYEFGDGMEAIDATRSLVNWVRRTGGEEGLAERDLEVRERERATACATALLIDVSHSMTLYGEDRITPAKRVALALVELITTRFPKDTIDVVLFGDEATTVPLERIPYLSNGPFHTNTKAGLALAQRLLLRRKGMNRQIVVLTDGKPSAIHDEDGLYKNPFGLDDRIVAATLAEAARCRRRGIGVTTFMLTADPYLRRFVERFTETCRGKAYFADSARLEGFVLVDFLRNRRRRVR